MEPTDRPEEEWRSPSSVCLLNARLSIPGEWVSLQCPSLMLCIIYTTVWRPPFVLLKCTHHLILANKVESAASGELSGLGKWHVTVHKLTERLRWQPYMFKCCKRDFCFPSWHWCGTVVATNSTAAAKVHCGQFNTRQKNKNKKNKVPISDLVTFLYSRSKQFRSNHCTWV